MIGEGVVEGVFVIVAAMAVVCERERVNKEERDKISKIFRTYVCTVSNLEHHCSSMLNFLRFDIFDVGGFFVFGMLNANNLTFSTPDSNALKYK